MSNENSIEKSEEDLPPISRETVRRVLALQEAELSTKVKELEVKELEINKIHEFSQGSLTAQLEDRKDARTTQQQNDKHRYYFLGFLALLLTGFLIFTVYNGEKAVALEIIKAIGLVLAGYFGGRFHQKKQDDKSKD